MNTRLNKLNLVSAALLLALAGTGNALAQQQSGANMPNPGTDRASCGDIEWHRDLLRDFPWVADACQEAVTVDGQKWARFEAEFEELNRDGSITSNFRDNRGRSLGTVDLQPRADQRVLLDGRPTRFSELRRGQVLNFYAPQGSYSFSTEPGAPDSDQLQVAERRNEQQRQADQRLADQRRDEQGRSQLAQADRSTSTRRDTLPATAGPLPMLALGGMLSLLGGATLSVRRRLVRSKV